MRGIATAAFLALASGAMPAAAQSTGFYLNGVVGAEFISSGGSAQSFGLIDLTFGIDPVSNGSWPGIGFEAGVLAFGGSSGSGRGVGFAAMTVALGGGRLHIGAPRNAVQGFNTTPYPGGSLAATVELGAISGTMPYSNVIALGLQEPGIGLRYDRSSGDMAFAVSALRFSNGGVHLDDLAFAVARQFGQSHVFGTVENLNGATNATIVTLGGHTTLGGTGSSLGAIEVGGSLTGLFSGGSNEATILAYVTAHPTDRLAVTLSAMHASSFGDTYGGLEVGYDLWNGVQVRGGVLAGGGGSALWSLGLRRNF